MKEPADLLGAVLADPGGDAPRLRFARWCERQPEGAWAARAELIRLQIELARTDPELVRTGQVFGKQHRVQELLDQFGGLWAQPLTGLADDFRFLRGFVGWVKVSARTFLERGEELFARAPVRHLDLTAVREVNEELFASPLLAEIRSLGMDACGLHDLHLQLLAASPRVKRLRWLSVAENHLGLPAARALAASEALGGLEFAEFRSNPVDPVERLGMDGGVVVASWLPPDGRALEEDYGHQPWLHREVPVDRFAEPDEPSS